MSQFSARLVSIVFHPLLVVTIFVFGYIQALYGIEVAKKILLLITFVAVLPIVLYNSIQLIRGKISNFDLSNRDERNKTYPYLMLLLGLLIALGYYYRLPVKLVGQLVIYALMIVVFYFFRNHLKISLHASTSFFLAMMVFSDFKWIGFIAIMISAVVALSRVALKRHTLKEVIVGSGSGIIAGLLSSLI